MNGTSYNTAGRKEPGRKTLLILKALKCVLFILIVLLLYTKTREILRDKSESEALGVLMKKPNESYDVILGGSSHMQYGIQPAVLDEKFGIKACNVSTAAQSIPTTYYVVREMAERNTPDVVVVDLFCAFWKDAYFTPTRFHQAIDNLPLDRIKHDAIINLVDGKNDETRSEFFLNYLLYHSRWKHLTRFDYKVHDEFDETQQYLHSVGDFQNDFVPVDRSKTEEIPDITLEYLEKIVQFCRDNDIRLMFTVVPYRADRDNNGVTGEHQQLVYNRIEEYCREWGVDYFNSLYSLEDMGFDFTTDMAEYSHLNEDGSRKVTEYYGKIIAGMLENK